MFRNVFNIPAGFIVPIDEIKADHAKRAGWLGLWRSFILIHHYRKPTEPVNRKQVATGMNPNPCGLWMNPCGSGLSGIQEPNTRAFSLYYV